MKQIIEFPLTRPTHLVPLSGDTQVKVITNGRVSIRENHDYRKRDPYHCLVTTDFGRLFLSPHGQTMTAKIILPIEEANEKEFYHQLRLLFEAFERECEI